MVTVSKEYHAMDIADVEEAVSRMVGRKVTVGEMDVTLNDNVLIDWMFEKKPEYSISIRNSSGRIKEKSATMTEWENTGH